jgi:hypothetical protein
MEGAALWELRGQFTQFRELFGKFKNNVTDGK